MKTKWEGKVERKLCKFITTGIFYKCFMKNIYNITHISPLIYLLLKRYIKRYKRKYLGWLQGETRKLHKIFEDKNLTESVHRKISHTMPNLAWCAKSFGCLKWFRMVCEISQSHAKMLVVGFLPLVFILASLIGLAKGYEVLQSLDSSCIWALTCIAMDFTKFFLILGLFQW